MMKRTQHKVLRDDIILESPDVFDLAERRDGMNFGRRSGSK